MYAHITNGEITTVQGRLPRGADADGQWIEPVTEDNAALCGWFPVVNVARPADTDTHTHDRSVELVNGTPTVVWTQRAWTAEELAARTADANRATIGARVQAHVDALKLIKNSSGTLTGLQLSNAVRALAAAQLDVMRFLHNRLDALD